MLRRTLAEPPICAPAPVCLNTANPAPNRLFCAWASRRGRLGGDRTCRIEGVAKFVYLCVGLYVNNARSDPAFSIAIRIGAAPNADYSLRWVAQNKGGVRAISAGYGAGQLACW